MQVYRRLDIGTAKLPPDQRLDIPHHLIDILDPGQVFTAGEYARVARPVLAEIAARGNLPVVAGGTGFYLKALFEGLAPAPLRDPQLRERLAKRGPERLHRLLGRLDPRAAARIHPNDRQKLVRALEICVLASTPVSDVQARRRHALEGFRTLLIGLDPPRDELEERIGQRVRRMFAGGLLGETRAILEAGYPADAKALESIGYAQAIQVLRGELTVEQAIEATIIGTRRYAKRQRTWFRHMEGVVWLPGFGHCPEIRHMAAKLVAEFLEIQA